MNLSANVAIDIGQELFNAIKNPSNGRIFTLMGPNGAGKTRLLTAMKRELEGEPHNVMQHPQPSAKYENPVRCLMVPATRLLQIGPGNVGIVKLATDPDSPAVWPSMIEDLVPLVHPNVRQRNPGLSDGVINGAIGSLANQLWEIVEAAFPKAVFMYATHNLIFATRPSALYAAMEGKDAAAIVRSFQGNRLYKLFVPIAKRLTGCPLERFKF